VSIARSVRFALAAAAAAAASGCGAADERSAVEPTATATATAGAPAARSGPARVQIAGFTFQPGSVTVKAGQRVRWTDRDAANHNVTFAKGPEGIGNLRQGRSASVRFPEPGTFAYVCTYHPGMAGTVVVE
jgi:amicyanin